MRKAIKQYWIVAITLFTLVGQGLLANGSSMVPVMDAEHHQAQMVNEQFGLDDSLSSDLNSDSNSQLNMAMLADSSQQTTDCHGNAVAAVVSQNSDSNGCCNGMGGCSVDCNHCLTISFTADITEQNLDIARAMNNTNPSTAIVDGFSVDFPPAFRPPIA
ncbi:hypothetical protein [Shewanella gaetbuli]|uniref:Uncharacterized protein n=1 Tax=Shewanella gaetbuli TaxID=220752 RepID=A0A9X1ZNQ8_9GAMM|nr:hypothetical protein [Shewanella gaetbuli]MCL1142825.1 hypothetical protein [Shewanella gaetbuli]